jgi:HPt (histidine-containing phosphotransfer) domain-containing protein
MDDYLSKPVRKEDLAKKISYWGQVFANRSSTKLEADIENSLSNTNTANTLNQNSQDLEFVLEIDWEYLEEISGGNMAFQKELLHAFVSSLPEHLDALTIAISQQHYAEVERRAHFIKGSSAAIGITGIAQRASILEETSKQGNLPENAKILLAQIIEGVEQIQNSNKL